MTNFKIGQKVVYKSGCNDPMANAPQDGEIVTIKDRCSFADAWLVEEYQFAKYGGIQYIKSRALRPLIYNNISAEIIEKFKLTEEKADVEIKETELV